ncbi:hypothetical protein BDP55DRAFT_650867 [Colletotrichum godetiae]|uniref:Uncharacterized protein n=1 Tax=Colletotrichum godetiae TaxID=1209918 RepID=A0AAJ0F2G6_9PEZI|nr:uncharacterized protein BDP55DRAFT_650867 [Colletotrichum godetiae]KAK1690478.1 hypothetical protein BDP55DRAFT_650867 [Colletotrichum godetiae]
MLIISAVNVNGCPGQSQKFRIISLSSLAGFTLAPHALFVAKGTSLTWQNFKRHPMTMTSLGPPGGSSNIITISPRTSIRT